MKKMYTVEQIREIAENYELDYGYIGIRTQEETFELGAIDHCSKVWDDGEETDEELEGISVTSINSRAVIMHSSEATVRTGSYYGNHIAIIGSDSAVYGEDEGELIMKDAVVLEILA